ncbi:ROK family protein [Mycoplasma sp. 613B]
MNKFATVDIGGTNVRFALIKEHKITKKIKFQTNTTNWQETLDKIVKLINRYEINKLAVCIPGPANYKDGIIFNTPNLKGWKNLNVKKYLLNNTKLEKIVFENDANAMALANHHFYNQNKEDITQFFTISTGFGAGLVINNQIYTGVNHLGQEIARIPLGEPLFSTFHLSKYAAELFVSGTGFALRASQLKDKKVEAKEVLENYNKDETFEIIYNESVITLAKTIATFIGILAPNLIVFGGSVTHKNSFFVKEAIKMAKTLCDKQQFKQVKFKFDKLKDNSALIGLSYLLNA